MSKRRGVGARMTVDMPDYEAEGGYYGEDDYSAGEGYSGESKAADAFAAEYNLRVDETDLDEPIDLPEEEEEYEPEERAPALPARSPQRLPRPRKHTKEYEYTDFPIEEQVDELLAASADAEEEEEELDRFEVNVAPAYAEEGDPDDDEDRVHGPVGPPRTPQHCKVITETRRLCWGSFGDGSGGMTSNDLVGRQSEEDDRFEFAMLPQPGPGSFDYHPEVDFADDDPLDEDAAEFWQLDRPPTYDDIDPWEFDYNPCTGQSYEDFRGGGTRHDAYWSAQQPAAETGASAGMTFEPSKDAVDSQMAQWKRQLWQEEILGCAIASWEARAGKPHPYSIGEEIEANLDADPVPAFSVVEGRWVKDKGKPHELAADAMVTYPDGTSREALTYTTVEKVKGRGAVYSIFDESDTLLLEGEDKTIGAAKREVYGILRRGIDMREGTEGLGRTYWVDDTLDVALDRVMAAVPDEWMPITEGGIQDTPIARELAEERAIAWFIENDEHFVGADQWKFEGDVKDQLQMAFGRASSAAAQYSTEEFVYSLKTVHRWDEGAIAAVLRPTPSWKEYGCGYYGCVVPTATKDIVLKLTTDSTEALGWAALMYLRETSPGVWRNLKDGYAEPFAVYKIADSSAYRIDSGKSATVYAIFRENADEVGEAPHEIKNRFRELKRSGDRLNTSAKLLVRRGGEAALHELRKLWDVAKEVGTAALLDQGSVGMEVDYKESRDAVASTLEFLYEATERGEPDEIEVSATGVEAITNAWKLCTTALEGAVYIEELEDTLTSLVAGYAVGFFPTDIHGGNVGLVEREGSPTWVVTDPGHVIPLADWLDDVEIEEI